MRQRNANQPPGVYLNGQLHFRLGRNLKVKFAKCRGQGAQQRFALPIQQGYRLNFWSQAQGSRIQHLADNG